MNKLHSTYQPGCFYTNFSNLPAAAQQALLAAQPEVECSRYTVWNYAGFLRAEVEIDGQWYAAEISFGDLEPESWRPEDDPDNSDNDDEYAEAILAELFACSEIEHATVYLTEID